jgi:hypothetical protein
LARKFSFVSTSRNGDPNDQGVSLTVAFKYKREYELKDKQLHFSRIQFTEQGRMPKPTVRFYVPQNAQNEVRYVPCCGAEEGSGT